MGTGCTKCCLKYTVFARQGVNDVTQCIHQTCSCGRSRQDPVEELQKNEIMKNVEKEKAKPVLLEGMEEGTPRRRRKKKKKPLSAPMSPNMVGREASCGERPSSSDGSASPNSLPHSRSTTPRKLPSLRPTSSAARASP